MIVVLTLMYVAILALLIKLKVIPLNLWTRLSPLFFILFLLLALFVPLSFYAPSGSGVVWRSTIAIIPNVVGEVTEVNVSSHQPLKAGDVMFRIDPRPYQAAVDGLQAQLALAKLRVGQSEKLASRDAGSLYELEAFKAQSDGLQAQLDNALFNLEQTAVRAPSNGYLTNLTLRPGSRAQGAPAGVFVEDDAGAIIVFLHQIHSRYIEPQQNVELVFKIFPGEVFRGEVEYIYEDIALGQQLPSGQLIAPRQLFPMPFPVRIKLEDESLTRRLPTGAIGTAAIYSDKFEAIHLIRKVMLRMESILNYVNPI
jgi:multidrug resistance efflux pump